MLWGTKHNLPYSNALCAGEVEPKEIKAMEALGRVVSPDLHQRYQHTGELPVVGSVSGTIYILRRNDRTIQIDAFACSELAHCIHLRFEYPPTDNIISLYLLLSHDENAFLEKANSTTLSRQEADDNLFAVLHSENLIIRGEDAYSDVLSELVEFFSDLDMPENECDLDFEQPSDDEESCIEPPSIPYGYTPHLDNYIPNIHHQNPRWLARLSSINYRLTLREKREQRRILQTERRITPVLNSEGKWVTQGLAFLVLLDDEIRDSDFAVYNTEHGQIRIPLLPHISDRVLDDICLHALLSSFAERVARQGDIHTDFLPATSIMSGRVWNEIGSMQIPDEGLLRTKIIIDDRAEDFVFILPEPHFLGVIPYVTSGLGVEQIGLGIVEDCFDVRFYNGRRLQRIDAEMAMEFVYGFFPDNNPTAIEYCMLAYNCRTITPRNCEVRQILDNSADIALFED